MPFLVPALISTTPPQTTQEVRSSGNVVLCCHLVGAAALPGVPLVLSSLPSRFFFLGGGLFIPYSPHSVHGFGGGQYLAEPEMWDELVGVRAQRAGTWGPGQGEREVASGELPASPL